MKIPVIQGLIVRRILVNFIAEANVVRKIIPSPFRPKLYKGKAVVGICLIRLKEVRPKHFPAFLSIGSENAAHRIAVEWDGNGEVKEGVFIPRRDTSSFFNHLAGGRIFPGRHHYARFAVIEREGTYNIAFKSPDGTSISLAASKANTFTSTSVFETLAEASAFFKNGAVGYSPNSKSYDGLELKTFGWTMEPLNVTSVSSSFFEDETILPKGSVTFDNALLMTKRKHEWHPVESKVCCS